MESKLEKKIKKPLNFPVPSVSAKPKLIYRNEFNTFVGGLLRILLRRLAF
jgi:hypothetical protein